MNIGHVIDFHEDGSAEAMHNDKFDLSLLGRQHIKRATDILFNDGTQTWGIFFPSPDGGIHRTVPKAQGFRTYEDARRTEVSWLNLSRAGGFNPLSMQGVDALSEIRLRTRV